MKQGMPAGAGVTVAAALALAALPGWIASSSAASGTTERVSVDSSAIQANGLSDRPSLSADGRYVTFEGANATNLVPGDTNGVADVFVRDRQLGITERVSVDSAAGQSDNGSAFAAISADGRFVAFQSIATNLVPDDTNTQIDVFLHDRQTHETTRVSVASDGSQATIGGGAPAMSGDGRYVAFMSPAGDLVAGDTNGTWDIFVRDRQSGTTSRVSVDSAGDEGNDASVSAAFSSDGRFVGFVSGASDLVADDTNGASDVFVHDLQTGFTSRVSVATGGSEGNGDSGNLASGDHDAYLSGDGRYVAFSSAASNLALGDTNGVADIFVHDRQTNITGRVSVDSSGTEANGDSFFPTITSDGRFVAFGSLASNLVPDDTNGVADVFVHDRQLGITSRVSVDSNGLQGNAPSPQGDAGFEPAPMSSDGSLIAFGSLASNLVPNDTNSTRDIFVHEQGADTIGGVTTVPDIAQTPLEATESSESNAVPAVVVAAAVLAGIITLGSTAWYVRKRWIR